MASGRESGEIAAEVIYFLTTRFVLGPPMIMIVSGMVHLDVWTSWPAWGLGQSVIVALALTLVSFFFRRQIEPVESS